MKRGNNRRINAINALKKGINRKGKYRENIVLHNCVYIAVIAAMSEQAIKTPSFRDIVQKTRKCSLWNDGFLKSCIAVVYNAHFITHVAENVFQ